MSNITSNSKPTLTKEHKKFLERLRRSGVINMYGAAPHLQIVFDLSDKDATSLLTEWMDTYDAKDKDYADL